MTKAADLALGKIAAVKTALIEFTDGDDAIAVADAGVVTLLTTAVAKSEGGAVTHNIAQGLCKHFCHWDGSGTVEVDDSFNQSTLTDNATGTYTIAVTNNMNNIHYTVTGSTVGSADSFNAFIAGHSVVHTTSQYKVRSYHVSSGAVDLIHDQCQIVGDLA